MNYSEHSKAICTRNEYLNRVTPLVIERLEKGFKQKDNGDLYKKDNEAIEAILLVDKPPRVRVYLDASSYSIAIKCDINYYTADENTIYIYEYVYIYSRDKGVSTYKARHLPTAEQLEYSTNKRDQLIEQRRDIDSQISTLHAFLEVSR